MTGNPIEATQIAMPIALPPLALEEITQSAEDPFAVLNAMLRAYNIGQVGPANYVPLWVFARDASGKVQGGVRGQTYWSWCTIDVLTVAQPYRRQGIGSRLLARVEEMRGHVVVLEFGSTPQAFKHLISTGATSASNLAASRLSARSYAALVHEEAPRFTDDGSSWHAPPVRGAAAIPRVFEVLRTRPVHAAIDKV